MIGDYYTGFEGYPEIVFYIKIGEKREVIRIWDGYFDNIMQKIQPNDDGWHSLAYYYHLDEGWYEDSPWKIPNNKDALQQLQTINIKLLDKKEQIILKEIINLLKENLNSDIYIEYS
ncbi:dihydroorotate dehydrogenase (quinone) [Bacillus aquiflavi]|uniref:dihydroorotate dehydrogenase (quinone) n=1 Tax=Bacillus aquiflavi TaxID=2672567 RepID=UPI001CA825C2|nr:dihydroorotate dehydrogenase (quinone) [Bacillus aquiflavi]UAC49997.1 dihydroorotate dehydrogenase (quinone) [Bacillus aquiflavi]